jgi:uncharacterized protein YbjT (DUF2867 family)
MILVTGISGSLGGLVFDGLSALDDPTVIAAAAPVTASIADGSNSTTPRPWPTASGT